MSGRHLVFDLGFHRGEDTDHYLAMGHRVVAVEANPSLAKQGRERFAAAISSGELTLIHAAVLGEGRALSAVAFHPHPSRSEWGSVDLRWVQHNAEAPGLPQDAPLMVQATTLQQLVAQFGTPWLLKIDIEGADEEVLADLAALEQKPAFVSWETGKESLAAVLSQHRRLRRLGYRHFRVVQQAYLERGPGVQLPNGTQYRFAVGSSGPTPADSPKPWRSLSWVALHYRLLFVLYDLIGPRSWFAQASRSRHRWLAWGPKRIRAWADQQSLPFPGWVDSHASL